MRFYIYVLLVLYSSSISEKTAATTAAEPHSRRTYRETTYAGHTCTSPEGKVGTCVSLTACSPLFQLLTNDGRNPETASFLKKSQCGNQFVNKMPVVCCPSAAASTTQPTTQPTTRPATSKPVTAQPKTSHPHTTSTSKPVSTSKPAINYGECGKSERQETRIVGGKNASLGSWPWMVALGYISTTSNSSDIDFKCGATLISNKWVITAAHCVLNLGSSKLTTARLGDLDLDANVKDGATPIDVPIEEIIPHPGYTTKPITNDIALLRLRNTVKFSRDIRPVCFMSGSLYRNDSYYTHKRPYIIGWGALEWRGPTSSMLQETVITVVNLTECAKIYAKQPTAKIDHRVLCAGEKGRDTCQGDSGGPLIFPILRYSENQFDTFHLGGIVSFGVRCADLTYPGVYTRVAAFTDWISETTGLIIDDGD